MLTVLCAAASILIAGVNPPAEPPSPAPKEPAKVEETKPTGLSVGDAVPDVTLKDSEGKDVKLSTMYKDKPLVLVFYRGGWCPFCNRDLKAWQGQLGSLEEAGGTLTAVSLEKLEFAKKTTEDNKLTYRVLVDSTGEAMRKFRLMFRLDDSIREKYKGYGIDLEKHNTTGEWELPITSTYVIGTDGKITWAWNDPDYKKRADPKDAIAAVKELTKKPKPEAK